ncbi:MAG: DUF3611 family protein [Desulfobacteraceae bacterium]|jgi:hypothetical protein|nr:DUF3611 family protein [Desulfobacteraceae bacterium]
MPKQNAPTPWPPSNPGSLAGQFSRLGWIGFWMQLVLVSIPVILILYVLFIGSPESAQRKGIDLSNYLSYGSLLVMLFTIYWFYRYTRLAKQIVEPESCPPQASVMQTLWVGLGASCLGILFSMILMMNAVLRMLFILLATPQTGIPIAAAGGDPARTLSAIDAVSLTSLLFILTAELMVLAFSLWLLFQVTRPVSEITDAASFD